MAYIDVNIPVIEKITLPSGNTYFIADREIRDVVEALSAAISGGVSFNAVYDGTSEPVVANIPAGVVVTYQGTQYTGTLNANNAVPGTFYLVKSDTQSSAGDTYDEYVPVGPDGSKTWERIGDTQVDLSNVVTDVSLAKQTDTVIGSDATFTITQPTITLETDAPQGAGTVTVATGIGSVTQPTVRLSANADTATGRVQVATGGSTESSTNTDWLKGVSVNNGILTFGAATTNTTYLGASASGTAVAPNTTNIKATASGANTTWNSKDQVTVLMGTTDVNVTKGNS